jgi:hypothetical protein
MQSLHSDFGYLIDQGKSWEVGGAHLWNALGGWWGAIIERNVRRYTQGTRTYTYLVKLSGRLSKVIVLQGTISVQHKSGEGSIMHVFKLVAYNGSHVRASGNR